MAVHFWFARQEDEETIETRPAKRRSGRTSADSDRSRRFPQSRGPSGRTLGADRDPSVDVTLSEHASLRLAQRHLTLRHLAYVLAYGTEVSRTGAVFHILRRRDIDPADRQCDEIAKLEGVAVVIQGGHLITVYRNRRSYGDVQKKPKHSRQRRRRRPLPATDPALAA
jgi:hypothetical protein